MGRKIKLELTLEQALALRGLAHSSDQYNSQDDRRLSRAEWNSLVKLEQAIEKVRGEFKNRMVNHVLV